MDKYPTFKSVVIRLFCAWTHQIRPYFVQSHHNVSPHSGFRKTFLTVSQTAAWGQICILVTDLSHGQQGLISDRTSGSESQAMKNPNPHNPPIDKNREKTSKWEAPRSPNFLIIIVEVYMEEVTVAQSTATCLQGRDWEQTFSITRWNDSLPNRKKDVL